MRSKDQAKTKVMEHIERLERQHGYKPKWIRIDEGRKYLNEKLKSALAAKGIEIRPTAPYSQSQNGVSERMNHTLVELARAMLAERNLPKSLREFVVTDVAYIRNRSPTRALPDGKTLHEVFTKEKLNVSHFQEFGAPIWIFREEFESISKLEERAVKNIFCGYLDGPKAVRYYDTNTQPSIFLVTTNLSTPPSNSMTLSPMRHPRERNTGMRMAHQHISRCQHKYRRNTYLHQNQYLNPYHQPCRRRRRARQSYHHH